MKNEKDTYLKVPKSGKKCFVLIVAHVFVVVVVVIAVVVLLLLFFVVFCCILTCQRPGWAVWRRSSPCLLEMNHDQKVRS